MQVFSDTAVSSEPHYSSINAPSNRRSLEKRLDLYEQVF
ncbi:hypothetical protein S7335_5256 [Synechococcus sp. PCC 7335]|nr:hypothetical protein S7335_5256 [Synechococcus sp. PCC 7335]